jgi:hypothetical protein
MLWELAENFRVPRLQNYIVGVTIDRVAEGGGGPLSDEALDYIYAYMREETHPLRRLSAKSWRGLWRSAWT